MYVSYEGLSDSFLHLTSPNLAQPNQGYAKKLALNKTCLQVYRIISSLLSNLMYTNHKHLRQVKSLFSGVFQHRCTNM